MLAEDAIASATPIPMVLHRHRREDRKPVDFDLLSSTEGDSYECLEDRHFRIHESEVVNRRTPSRRMNASMFEARLR
jgi:hypothetical protein